MPKYFLNLLARIFNPKPLKNLSGSGTDQALTKFSGSGTESEVPVYT